MKILIQSLAMAVAMIVVLMLNMFIVGLVRWHFGNDIGVACFIMLLPVDMLVLVGLNMMLDKALKE